MSGQAWTSVAELNLLYSAVKDDVGTAINVQTAAKGIITGFSGRTVQLNLMKGTTYTVCLIQLNGRTLQKQNVLGNGEVSFNLGTNLGTGIYLLQIEGAGIKQLLRVPLK